MRGTIHGHLIYSVALMVQIVSLEIAANGRGQRGKVMEFAESPKTPLT